MNEIKILRIGFFSVNACFLGLGLLFCAWNWEKDNSTEIYIYKMRKEYECKSEIFTVLKNQQFVITKGTFSLLSS